MNKLSASNRARILHLLCEGNSIRAVTRLTSASKNTVSKLLMDAGKACTAYRDEHVRNVQAKRVQVNEIWSFTYSNQKNVAGAVATPDSAGDAWTWTAIDTDSKLVLSYFICGRDGECAAWFIGDVKTCFANRVQLTTDGHKSYLQAVEDAFGADVDYTQLATIYGSAPSGAMGRDNPAECTGIKKTTVEDPPDEARVFTSYVERQNLTMQVYMSRFTRITNAFLKKVEKHAYAVALHFMYYNFVRFHPKLRISPAMAAGVSDRL